MITNEKISLYNQLVEDVNHCPNIEKCSLKIKMTLCKSCKEVNLWTYWEGGRDRLDAEILLVGQDWGQLSNKDNENLKIDDAINFNGYTSIFPIPADMGITDRHLCTLFKEIEGCEDLETDFFGAGRNCKKVFFTNFVCCYRKGNTSGGFDPRWIVNCKDYFRRLVNIIQPKAIVCLGRHAFDGVSLAAGKGRSKGAYNDIIIAGGVDMNFGKSTAKVFPVAHPGAMGSLNRCRAKDNISKEHTQKRGLKLQISDWQKINF